MKTVQQALPFDFYGPDNPARVAKARDGSYRAIGGGFAGRVRYRTVERAARVIESHALFTGWQPQ